MNDNDNEYHYITQGNTILYVNPKCIINPEPTDTPYLKGTITSINNSFNTITIDNLPNNIPFSKTLPIYNAATINTNDMQAIPNLTEVDLLNNLSNRLTVSKTSFTNVGNTLLIVNPYYKDDSVYTNAQIEKYIQLHTTNPPALRVQHEEPHLYDVVLIAIENLLNKHNKHNQAIIISGESGAGKTETAKNCMECIAYYFDRKGNYETLAKQIIACNPILEAFGNAKTIRNDNSSRFGKYVTINVDTNMNVIKGASIKTYLLEKTRITRLNADERNFHFFYQLLNCGDSTLLTSLYLVNDVMCYKYLNCSNEVTLSTINDKEQFQRTMQCFHTLNFTQDEINTVLKLVAAVLLIGNITFTSHDDNNIQISNNCDNTVSNVCELLACDENEFKRTLTTKVRVTANSTTETPLTVDNANTCRDSFAKELYIRLFKWIVTKMNNKLNIYNSDNSVDNSNSDDIKYIGLLDIFGFECYKVNSLEQLCINYTNEQLHQLYIKDYFEEEVNEFKREGLNDQVSLLSYTNNQHVIELIDKYPNGLFLLLDNATMLNKNEDYLLNEIRNQHNKHKAIKIPKVIKDNKLTVTINHTAKDVVYDITHFIPKNKEQVEHTMTTLIAHSSNEIIKKIYFNALTSQQLQNEIQSITNNQHAMRNESKYLSGKFRQDIHTLIDELKHCECNYIRCIIPNNDKKPFTVYPYMLYKQIQYLGILDTIRIRNEGYSNRWTYQSFNDEYQMVFNNNVNVNDAITTNHKDVTHMIIKQLIPNENEYEMNGMPLVLFGNSKLYMKKCFYTLLQRRKEEMLQHKIKAAKLMYMSVIYLHKKQKVKQLHTHINKIQTHFRLLQHRNKYTSVINKVSLIQNAFHSHMSYHIFKRRIKNILLIQSVLHTQCERLSIQHKQFLMKFIQLRIAMYSNVLHDVRRQKMKNVVKDILNNVTNVIVDNEYAKIWKKVSPFFKRVITTKKHNDVVKCKKNYKIGTVMNMFIVKHLLHKVSIKKNAALQLRQHSLTKLTFNYYLKMWEVSLTIQNYIKRYLHKESAQNKIIRKCLNERESNINDITNTINDIYKVIFPSTNNNNNSNSTKHNLNKSSSVSNITNNNSISINKYSMQRCGSSVVINAQPTYNNNNINKQQQSNSNITAMQKHSMQYNLPHINAYSLGKIKFFARILSIDIYLNINTIYDNEWHSEFSSIYNSNIASNTPIQQIHLGENHTLLINSKGKVFTWGWNNNSQCCNENVPYIDNMILPCFNGKGNVCGYSGDMPLIYYSKGNVIKHEMNFINNVSCGDECSFIVDEGGNMYGFGCNENGEICKCSECKVDKPWLIGSVLKGKVKDVKTTKQFTIVITKDGECYYWLHKSNSSINVICGNLCKIEFNNSKTEIAQIACGYNFAMLLTKSGIIYAMGNNKNNILGLSYNNNNNDFIYEPQHVSTITDKIIQIKCGFKHTVCISSAGKVFTWGNNTYGQLGLGSSKIENVSLPVNVTSLSKTLSNTKIVNVDAGFKSTVMLSDNHCIYYTGVLDRENSSMSVVKFDITSKSSEIAEESSYVPVKVYCTWNKHMSVFYTVVADVREVKLEGISGKKINAALGMLSMKWCYDTVLCPYVESIAGYFSSGQMRKEGK